jgi:hypothetical protein
VAPTQLLCTLECCKLLRVQVHWHLSKLWGRQAALLLLLLLLLLCQDLCPLQVLLHMWLMLSHGLELCLGMLLHLA